MQALHCCCLESKQIAKVSIADRFRKNIFMFLFRIVEPWYQFISENLNISNRHVFVNAAGQIIKAARHK